MGQRHILNRLSNAQVFTASAASTVYIDKALVGEIRDGSYFEFKVGTAFAGGTSIRFDIESDTDNGFATALVTHLSSAVVLTAALIAGAVFRVPWPTGTQRFVRAYYTVVGTMSGGGSMHANLVNALDLDNAPA